MLLGNLLGFLLFGCFIRFRQGAFKAAYAFPDTGTDSRQFSGSENKQHDNQNNRQFRQTNAEHKNLLIYKFNLQPFAERTVRVAAFVAVFAKAAVPQKSELCLSDMLTGQNSGQDNIEHRDPMMKAAGGNP